MTDTARDYQTLTTADTNGLDDLFDVAPTPADNQSQDVAMVATFADNQSGDVGGLATDVDSGQWIIASEAASALKKSERTI